MGRTCLLTIAFLLFVVCAACSDADALVTGTDFASIAVSPASAELSTAAPGNMAALTVTARNKAGKPISSAGGVLTYASNAPATARVSHKGIVTALTAGSAVMTVAMTLGDVTRTATAPVTVREPGAWPALGGVYDLKATITHADPAWGIKDGTRQLAVLTILHGGEMSPFTGGFKDFRAVAPGATDSAGNPGSLRGTVQTDGRIFMELTFPGDRTSYWTGRGTVTAEGMSGDFGAGEHVRGTFTAKRR